MRFALALLAILAIAGFSQAKFHPEFSNCALIPVNGTELYNLCAFAQYRPLVNVTSGDGLLANTIFFSLGSKSTPTCANGVNDKKVWATTTVPGLGCQEYSSEKNASYPAFALTTASTNDTKKALNITFATEYKTETEAIVKGTVLQINLVCNKAIKKVEDIAFQHISTSEVRPDGTRLVLIEGESRYGCAYVDIAFMVQFFHKHHALFAVLFGALGLVLAFFGLRLISFTVFVLSALVTTIITGELFFQFTTMGGEKWVPYAVFAICVLVGLGVGYLALKLEKVAYFIIGFALGGVSGTMVFGAFIADKTSGTAPLYIFATVCAIIGAIAGLYLYQHILILATSLIGSYLFLRAIGSFFHGFPDENTIVNAHRDFHGAQYAWLAGVVVLCIVSMIFQYKTRTSREENAKQINDNYQSALPEDAYTYHRA